MAYYFSQTGVSRYEGYTRPRFWHYLAVLFWMPGFIFLWPYILMKAKYVKRKRKEGDIIEK
jgi:hypothetical protein